jgi:hypothetical protein
MTNRFGGMPLAPEMDPLEAEIGSDQRLLAAGNCQDGAIVSNAGCNASPPRGPTPNASDQEFFGLRQGGPNPSDRLIYGYA